jgi:CRP-like cAMP-binding protein
MGDPQEVESNVPMNPLIRKMERLFPLTFQEKEVLERACSHIVNTSAQQDLVRDGERPTRCNLLLSGTVCRYKQLPGGKRQILSLQFPGDIFDAQSFLLGVMDHGIAALTDCELGIIPHSTMAAITENHPRIARAIWKDTLVDAAVFREWITNIGRRNAHGRIAHLMCEVYVRSEAVGVARDGKVQWPMTQSELGDATGISPVHVNRVLQELRSEGLIILKGKTLQIIDFEGLQRAGGFDPDYLHLSPTHVSREATTARAEGAQPVA